MVLDVELLAQAVAQLLCDQARHCVGRACRSERHNDLDRPGGISRGVLCLCAKTGELRGEQQRACRPKAQRSSHRFLPFYSS
jgi:hypothetical protein